MSEITERRYYYEYKKLVLEHEKEVKELERKLFQKDQVNDKLLIKLDEYRTKNNKQGIKIAHLEHLVGFFMRGEHTKPVEKSPEEDTNAV